MNKVRFAVVRTAVVTKVATVEIEVTDDEMRAMRINPFAADNVGREAVRRARRENALDWRKQEELVSEAVLWTDGEKP